jgi:hypothetical protein
MIYMVTLFNELNELIRTKGPGEEQAGLSVPGRMAVS